MFKNLSEILAQLKLLREVIATKDLNKIGDLLEVVSKLIGYGDFGVTGDDILDAIAERNWSKVLFSVGTLMQQISTKLPNGQPVNFGFQGILTGGTLVSNDASALDKAISTCENLERQTMAADAPPTDLPISVWIMIAQGVFQGGMFMFKLWRERQKNQPTK